ncbi:MAG: alcohol dehydrogenase catalytic domain-containing protein, partial [Cellulomonadaceae bacterium]|nr:alcohol dehydrogenase catalytic domain-containing protein [Cellulomonadaceae bacterium]
MYGAGDVRVETVPDPIIQQPTDAIVRVVRACVCGSDLHPYHSMAASSTGNPMGHELIGVVEETGAQVTSVRQGDLVVAPFAFQDNTCAFCREGFHTSCVHGGWYGSPQTGGLQAELARIPLADGSLVVVPDTDPATAEPGLLASLLALSDVYLTGHHAAHMGRVEPGKTVTVIGDGAVGLSA